MSRQRQLWPLALLLATLTGCGQDSVERGGPGEAHSPDAGSSSDAAIQQAQADIEVPAEPPAGLRLPVFETLTAESGFDFSRFDDMRGQRRIVETNGGGVGLIDFDADGQLDIFMTDGCRLPVDMTGSATPSALFRNLGGMRFEQVSVALAAPPFRFDCGCAVGDIDSDGFDDLYVTAFGANALWKNNGDGTFSDITTETGTVVRDWSSSAAFADINGDGYLDLYVVNYLNESAETPHLCLNSASPTGFEGCSPAILDGVDDALFLSDGAGSMIDVSATCGLAGLGGKGLGVVITDLDGEDSVPEIYVANDGEANFLFRVESVPASVSASGPVQPSANPGDDLEVHLTNEALASATALNESGFAQASMGIAAGDYDEDDATDLFLTHFFGDTNTLYRNTGQMTFSDETRSSRLGASSRQTLGFGTVFIDANLDGWLDLFIANGHVDDRTWMSEPQPYRMPPQLMLNRRDGTFADASNWAGPYFAESLIGRGVAAGDLDADGRTDLVVSHQLGPSAILQNRTEPTGDAWFSVRLIGTSSNRNAIGAKLTLSAKPHAIHRIISGGGSFQSASSRQIQFHTASSEPAVLEVHWPSGSRQKVTLMSGQQVSLVEQY